MTRTGWTTSSAGTPSRPTTIPAATTSARSSAASPASPASSTTCRNPAAPSWRPPTAASSPHGRSATPSPPTPRPRPSSPSSTAICRPDGDWDEGERVIVFTEYQATQQWLAGILTARGLGGDRLGLLFGGMDENKREHLKAAFQADLDRDPVRILLATDAASEGIDLQRHCHRVIHYDIPFNPNRLEQRIGRVDRHGQTHEVEVVPLRRRRLGQGARGLLRRRPGVPVPGRAEGRDRTPGPRQRQPRARARGRGPDARPADAHRPAPGHAEGIHEPAARRARPARPGPQAA